MRGGRREEVHENLRVGALIKAGHGKRMAFITVMFLAGCLVAMYFVDLAGRRPLVIYSFIWAGLASSLSRIGAAIGTYLVPEALSHIGIGPTMIIAAVITLVGAGVSVAWAPETRGLTLSESAALGSKTTARSGATA